MTVTNAKTVMIFYVVISKIMLKPKVYNLEEYFVKFMPRWCPI